MLLQLWNTARFHRRPTENSPKTAVIPMNQFQPISSETENPSAWTRLARALNAFCRRLFFWLEDEPAVTLNMKAPAQPPVVICYQCRRRVNQQELESGVHNHAKAAAASGTHAHEQ